APSSYNVRIIRNTLTVPIKAQQQIPLRHSRCDSARPQYRAENGADARRPAERERDSDDIGGNRSSAANIHMQAELPLQPGELRQPHHEQSEQDDHYAADEVCLVSIGEEQLPD